jgi:DNA-directed RNA polymerase II subunit RPB2
MDLTKIQKDLLFSHDRLYGPATDAIRSFDHFMDHMVPYIVREFSKFELVSGTERHNVQFGDITVHRPLIQDLDAPHKSIRVLTNEPLMPMEARNRGLTYSAEVFVNIEHTIRHTETHEVLQKLFYREVPLMSIPVMLRSKYCHLSDTRNLEALRECPNDMGGYFIIRGNAKVIQPQKVQRINVHVVKHGGQNQPIDLEIRSLQADRKFRSTSTLYVHFAGTPPVVSIDIPYLAEGHNIVLVFRALGLSGRDAIESFLWSSSNQDNPDPRQRLFEATLLACEASDPMVDLNRVYDMLGSGMYNEADLGTPEKIRRQVAQQVAGELLPHCGFDDSEATKFKKLIYLRTIVHHMLNVYTGASPPDDRDFEGFKAVHMSATILSTMFRQLFSAFVKSVRNKMFDRFKKSKHLDIAAFVAHSDALSRDVLKAFSDGEVTVKQASNAGTGVIQLAHQVNPLGLTTHIQRVSTALPKDGKYTLMRGVDSTQLFSYCPAETPEGHGAGLLQNLTLFARVRLGTEGHHVSSAILHSVPSFASESCGIHETLLMPLVGPQQLRPTTVIIFVNGEPVAVTETPDALMVILRRARRAKVIPIDSSVIRVPHGLAIFTDMGTVQFPLICLETLRHEGHKLRSMPGELFKNMMSLGIIEYVEAWEALDYRVAFKADDLSNPTLMEGLTGPLMPFTHIAVHPMAILGTSASSVPWSDHDQAPRVSYQAGMLKQAVSTPAMNLHERFDLGYAHTLWYPQRPLADTVVSESRGLHDWPMGENLLIAIGSYDGLSQEDAIVRSKASIERGSGRITVHRVFKAVVHKINASDFEAFECPIHVENGLSCIGIRAECDYTKVDCNGLPIEQTYVRNGDVLIGRVLYTTDDSGNRVRRDRSIILTCEDSEDYLVDRVMLTTNRDGFRQVRVRVRSMRVPQVGDKISDRHGQKGVIGALVSQEDLPYVASGPNAGMTPDAIVNLHSINGRMTIGKLLEMLFSNVGLAKASFMDASPFHQVDASWAIRELLRAGYGTEVHMMDGRTGMPMSTPWFIGSCFYQSLKHMVLDKIAARNRGPRAALTRQPLEGRAKQGGLRVGEMERDAFLAHGASMTLDDRSRVASDGHVAPVCRTCGQIGETSAKFTIKSMLAKDTLEHSEACRICGGPIQRINTTYCYSNLLVRELATVGIKVEHFFEDTKAESTALDVSTEIPMDLDEIINVAT